MSDAQAEAPVHSVTLQFSGPLGQKMADHFFSNWQDGGLDEIWQEALSESGIAESIAYDWNAETRTFLIEAVDDDEEDEDDEKSDDDESDDDEDDSTSDEAEEEDKVAKQAVEGQDEAAA